jgi:hypothetical protein
MTAYAAATLLLGAHMLPHTMQAIALRRRLPGLAGGLTISLPYSVLVVRRLLHRRLVAPDALARAAAAGAVLLVPAVLGVRALGRAVACLASRWPGRPLAATLQGILRGLVNGILQA